MDKVKAYKDFITESERDELNEWTLSNYERDIFMDPKMDTNKKERTKLTTRFATPLVIPQTGQVISSPSDFDYPAEAYWIQDRILRTFDIEEYGFAPVGLDGIITEISFEGGTVHRHIDPVWMEDTVTVHFNIISRKPKGGGVTIIDGEPWDVEDTDLLSYIVSDAEHEVDEIVGKKNRILWVFAFMLSKKDAKRIFSGETEEDLGESVQ